MGNFCSKCGKKHDAKKYKSQEETEDNKRNVTTATKQTSVPIKNESNNSGSTGVITSDSKQPSNQKPDLSESGSGNKNPNKKKKRYVESSDSSETSDSSSDTDSSDSGNGHYQKKSTRKYKNKHGGTTLVSKKMTVLGNYMNIGSGAKNVNLTITNSRPFPPTPEKTAEVKTRFEPFNSKTRKEFFSHKSRSIHNAGNFIYLPENNKGRVEEVLVSKLKDEWAKSVCLIKYPGGSASGFRIGSPNRNLLCTANHVVEGIMNTGMSIFGPSRAQRVQKLGEGNVWSVFNYLDGNCSISETDKFYFKPVLHYFNPETDIAILELRDNQYGIPMPQPFKNFATPILEDPFYLIGHPNGLQKKSCYSDNFISVISTETANHINIVRRWCQDKSLTCEVDGDNMLDNPKRWLFHVAENFTKGASGCPGLVINPPDAIVVTVLLRGYPDWYYDSAMSDQIKGTLPDGYRVEQGTNLASLCWDMKNENPGLCKEMFGL